MRGVCLMSSNRTCRTFAILLELPCRDAVDEQLIQFFVRKSGRLGLTKPQVNQAKHAETTENEGHLGTQVGLVRVEEVGKHKPPHGLRESS